MDDHPEQKHEEVNLPEPDSNNAKTGGVNVESSNNVLVNPIIKEGSNVHVGDNINIESPKYVTKNNIINHGQFIMAKEMNASVQYQPSNPKEISYIHKSEQPLYEQYYLSLLNVLKNDPHIQFYISNFLSDIHNIELAFSKGQVNARYLFEELLSGIINQNIEYLEKCGASIAENSMELLINNLSGLKTLALSTSNDRHEIGKQIGKIITSINRQIKPSDSFSSLLHLVHLFQQWNQSLL
ncbi:MAG: hypothetical protein ACKV1O_28430 [Saprospiraceae bacterium]